MARWVTGFRSGQAHWRWESYRIAKVGSGAYELYDAERDVTYPPTTLAQAQAHAVQLEEEKIRTGMSENPLTVKNVLIGTAVVGLAVLVVLGVAIHNVEAGSW